jgi:hypothetical protein
MTPTRRIASLLRELAQAFEELELDRPERKPRKPRVPPPSGPVDEAAVARVRRTLRRKGIAA